MRTLAAALALSALAATVGFAATNLDADMSAVLGKALFERDWVPGRASTDAADGLGPLFAARGCSGCHAGKLLAARFADAPEGRVAGRGLVVRFGDAEGNADPIYGRLLQNQAMQGMKPEGRIVLTGSAGANAPLDVAVHLNQGPLDPTIRQSVRIAPPLVGRAGLELVDADGVAGHADPDDRDGDGVSGRARMVTSDGRPVLGRYGWKASVSGLDEQVADAFATDLGLSSAARPFPHGDCTSRESECLAAPTGESAAFEGHELSGEMIGLVAAYVRSLAPPPPPVMKIGGSRLFADAGCATCHVPSLLAIDGAPVSTFSDLLLHDMGEDLDDGVGEPGVVSAEWRTAPLIGMAEGDGRRYLHHGRAATLDAAIRAHGGEAAGSLSRYLALTDSERLALIDFVGAL